MSVQVKTVNDAISELQQKLIDQQIAQSKIKQEFDVKRQFLEMQITGQVKTGKSFIRWPDRTPDKLRAELEKTRKDVLDKNTKRQSDIINQINKLSKSANVQFLDRIRNVFDEESEQRIKELQKVNIQKQSLDAKQSELKQFFKTQKIKLFDFDKSQKEQLKKLSIIAILGIVVFGVIAKKKRLFK